MENKKRVYQALRALCFVLFVVGSVVYIVTPLASLWSVPSVLVGLIALWLAERYHHRAKEAH